MIIIKKATIQNARSISYLIQKNTEGNPNHYSDIQLNTWKSYNTTSKIKAQFLEREIYVAYKGNRLVGTIALKKNEIAGFYVSYSQRGKGIGKQLLYFIQKKAVDKDYKELILTATPSAVKFYTNHGFTLIEEVTVTLNKIAYQEFAMKKTLVK